MSRVVGICCTSTWANVIPVSVLRVVQKRRRAGDGDRLFTPETIVMSAFVFLPRVTMTFSCVTVAKPFPDAVTAYVPGGRLRKWNRPLESAVVVAGALVPVSVRDAPAMGEPLSSETWP